MLDRETFVPPFVLPDMAREWQELNPQVEMLLSIVRKEYPELADVELKVFSPEDEFDGGGYYKFFEDADGQPLPVICISAGDPRFLAPLMAIRRSSIEINAEMLGIEYEKMTLELLQLFIIAHEFGHIKDFKINFQADSNLQGWEAVDIMEYQRDAVLSMLPAKNISPTHLASKLRDAKTLEDAIKLFPEIMVYPKFHEIKSVGDLLRAQEIEYRSSPPESYADTFAAGLLLQHAKELGISEILEMDRLDALAA